MTQQELDRSVASATGESLRNVRRRGFSVIQLDSPEPDFDPEDSAVQIVDWDALESRRRAA